MPSSLLTVDDRGLYCEAGGFHIDPWRPVPNAIITHAHGDHARRGMGRYLGSTEGARVLRTRMGADANIDTLPYGEEVTIGSTRVSFHPAGHILGSSQIRVEHKGEVWVVSGDYKVFPDRTCTPFEPVKCHTFVTESTFGMPIYRWPDPALVSREINTWWRENQQAGRTSLLMGYALGKAQRLIGLLDPSIGPIYTHGAVEALTQDYRDSGIDLPPTTLVVGNPKGFDWSTGIVIAPPSVQGTVWMRKFGDVSMAFASGWMMIRGTRRRRAVDRGFVVSDHADWPELLSAIHETGCERVLATHGSVAILVRWLREQGLAADGLETRFEGDEDAAPEGEVDPVLKSE
jgi:putative mRNA 3-end processing factor